MTIAVFPSIALHDKSLCIDFLSHDHHLLQLMQVTVKRTNRPGISTTNRGRGRGRGRGMRGGGFNPYFGGMMMMPMQPMYYRGGRGRAFRYVRTYVGWSHDHLVAMVACSCYVRGSLVTIHVIMKQLPLIVPFSLHFPSSSLFLSLSLFLSPFLQG